MTGLRRALATLAVLAAGLVGLAVFLVARSDHVDDRVIQAIAGGVLMTTWIGVGLFAWARRPANRVGALMTATGFAAFFGALAASDDPVLFGLGVGLANAYLGFAVHMLLAFPTGRLGSRAQRWLVGLVYALTIPLQLVFVLFARDCECADRAPANGLLLVDAPAVADVIRSGGSALGAVAVLAVALVLVRRWRASAARERRVLAPVLLSGVVMVILLGGLIVLQAVGLQQASEVVAIATVSALAVVPFAFIGGLQRSRAWRAGAVSELLEALGTAPVRGDLRAALAEALGDTTLELAYWLPDRGRFVDTAGRLIELPGEDAPARAATEVEREGRRVGAIVHDRALCDDPDLLRSTASAAALALANERLDAELRARVDELRRSREFLIETSLAERRSLERDLHDGAQQRLVSLVLQLGLVAKQLERGPETLPAARELLEASRDEARAALDDLRELARGIHPAVLTDRGLQAALEALADRAPLPVTVDVPERRLSGPVEAAAYFVVAESLTNVAKYASANRARVRVAAENGHALIEVSDDGVGGADPAGGTGLRGLGQRLAALDGRLEIDSEPGRGTTVRATVPWTG